jgi:hypothetical protein
VRTAIGLLAGWLLAALLVLGIEGRLPAFLAWVLPGSLLVLGVDALVRQQRAPSPYTQPSLPERYRSPTTSAGRWPTWWPWLKRKPGPDGSRYRCPDPPLPSWTTPPGARAANHHLCRPPLRRAGRLLAGRAGPSALELPRFTAMMNAGVRLPVRPAAHRHPMKEVRANHGPRMAETRLDAEQRIPTASMPRFLEAVGVMRMPPSEAAGAAWIVTVILEAAPATSHGLQRQPKPPSWRASWLAGQRTDRGRGARPRGGPATELLRAGAARPRRWRPPAGGRP